jgi:hypothetical protein
MKLPQRSAPRCGHRSPLYVQGRFFTGRCQRRNLKTRLWLPCGVCHRSVANLRISAATRSVSSTEPLRGRDLQMAAWANSNEDAGGEAQPGSPFISLSWGRRALVMNFFILCSPYSLYFFPTLSRMDLGFDIVNGVKGFSMVACNLI